MEIATGTRSELSPECRRISWLPPIVIGLFQGGWDMFERRVADALGVREDEVTAAWTSLEQEMIRAGQEAVVSGMLTKDYVAEVAPSLVIGLPARVFLDTLERSPKGSIVLASGLEIKRAPVRGGDLGLRVWRLFREAQDALTPLEPLAPADRAAIAAGLLAGGADTEDLPPNLAAAVLSLPDPCRPVMNPLIAIAVEASRAPQFKDKLGDVVVRILETN